MKDKKENNRLFFFLLLIVVGVASCLKIIWYVHTKIRQADAIHSVITDLHLLPDTIATTKTEDTSVVPLHEDTKSTIPPELIAQGKDPHKFFQIFVTAEPEGEDSTGAHLNISKKDGTPYKTIELKSVRYPVDLDLNEDLLLKFYKKGFETKIVYFNTHVPKGREKEEFARFIVDVGLAKKPKGATAEIVKYPGGVEYDKAAEDFVVKK